MELDDLNSGFAVHESMKDNFSLQAEKIEDVKKPQALSFTPEDEKRLVRKLDFW
jgi:hypothetical protein